MGRVEHFVRRARVDSSKCTQQLATLPVVTTPTAPPQRVFVCFDKFKGALTAREAGEIVSAVIRRARPTWEIELGALSDGGDGFCAIVTAASPESKSWRPARPASPESNTMPFFRP